MSPKSVSNSEVCKTITKCRVCASAPLVKILSLGKQYVSNFIDSKDAIKDEEKYPLELVLCDTQKNGCGLLQLRHTVSPEKMYRTYWYFSGMNKTMTDELGNVVKSAEGIVKLKKDDIVVDIGANDGTLLKSYKRKNIILTAYEPAKNLAPITKKTASVVFNDFFHAAPFIKKFGEKKKAKVVTAIAMFYDLDKPNDFVSDVGKILDKNGIFIIQMNYLVSMLRLNAFDNIGHEHLEYYSLMSLEHLLKQNGLEVFDVELNSINGGSFRIYIRHAKSSIGNAREGREARYKNLIKIEKNLGLGKQKVYQDFVKRIEGLKKEIVSLVKSEIKTGKKVYIYGASNRGNTLLQYFGLHSGHLTAAADRNPVKWGMKTIGTNIPIVSEDQARKDKPDYFLVLPWAFLKEFVSREKEYLTTGGKFIVPLPTMQVIDGTFFDKDAQPKTA